jgi:hypothetical protein
VAISAESTSNVSWQIKVETKEDLELLKSLFEGSVEKIQRGTSRFSDELSNFVLRFWDAIEAAEEVADLFEEATSEAPKAVKKPAKKRAPKFKPNLCPAHPDKALVQAPRTDCKGCWDAYKRLHPMEYDNKRRAFERKQRST